MQPLRSGQCGSVHFIAIFHLYLRQKTGLTRFLLGHGSSWLG
jgi:hypothetical protein